MNNLSQKNGDRIFNYKFFSTLSLLGFGTGIIPQVGNALIKPLGNNSSTPKPKFFYGSGGIKIPINTPTNKTSSKITTPTSLPSSPKSNKPGGYFYKNGIKIPIFETSKSSSSAVKSESIMETKITDAKPSKPILPSIDTVKIVSSKYQSPSGNSGVTVEKIYVDLTKLRKQSDETKSNIPPATILKENPTEDKFIATKVTVLTIPTTYLSFYKPRLQTIHE